MAMAAQAADAFRSAVSAGPLVQCITNYVSMDIMANVLLAAGLSPAMAHSLDEVEQFVGISSALLVNMGMLESTWVAAKKLAAKQVCQESGQPVRRVASLSPSVSQQVHVLTVLHVCAHLTVCAHPAGGGAEQAVGARPSGVRSHHVPHSSMHGDAAAEPRCGARQRLRDPGACWRCR